MEAITRTHITPEAYFDLATKVMRKAEELKDFTRFQADHDGPGLTATLIVSARVSSTKPTDEWALGGSIIKGVYPVFHECYTWDDYGDLIPNDFDWNELDKYFPIN